MPQTRPPLVSIVSPEDLKELRTMQLVTAVVALIQLGCSIAIMLIVRYQLGGHWQSPVCLAATPAYPLTCEYAYVLAAVSIFFGFWMSFTQCLTMDCCGAGRLFEAMFNAVAFCWWLAGAITLTVRATAANDFGVAQADARNAVVALSWISCALVWVLMSTNITLMKSLGRAYKAADQELQPHVKPKPTSGIHVFDTYPQTVATAQPPAGPPVTYHQADWGPEPPPGSYPQARQPDYICTPLAATRDGAQLTNRESQPAVPASTAQASFIPGHTPSYTPAADPSQASSETDVASEPVAVMCNPPVQPVAVMYNPPVQGTSATHSQDQTPQAASGISMV